MAAAGQARSGFTRLGRAELVCTLSDRGAALPARHLPGGDLAVPELRPETLPEGGFGWLLIRKLTRDIHYARTGGSNRLTVWFDLPDPDSGAGA
jgi:serine/threonine-protein kinase RsbW